MKSFLNFLVNTIIFLLISVGSFLIAWRFIEEDVILYFTQVPIVTEDFETNLIETAETAEFDWDVVSELDATYWMEHVNVNLPVNVPANINVPWISDITLPEDEVHPIGELLIPSIDARLPIFLGVGEPNITIGVGTMHPTFVMGERNITLASHWDPNPGVRFGGLHLVGPGDLLILRSSTHIYIYETFIFNEIIEPDQSYIADEDIGGNYLTLFTCTPGGAQRLMVRGEFVERVSIADFQAAVAAEAAGGEVTAEAVPDDDDESNDDEADDDDDNDEEVDDDEEDTDSESSGTVDLGRLDVEIITNVIETIEETEVPFPTTGVALAVGGSLLLGLLVVRISNGRRR